MGKVKEEASCLMLQIGKNVKPCLLLYYCFAKLLLTDNKFVAKQLKRSKMSIGIPVKPCLLLYLAWAVRLDRSNYPGQANEI